MLRVMLSFKARKLPLSFSLARVDDPQLNFTEQIIQGLKKCTDVQVRLTKVCLRGGD